MSTMPCTASCAVTSAPYVSPSRYWQPGSGPSGRSIAHSSACEAPPPPNSAGTPAEKNVAPSTRRSCPRQMRPSRQRRPPALRRSVRLPAQAAPNPCAVLRTAFQVRYSPKIARCLLCSPPVMDRPQCLRVRRTGQRHLVSRRRRQGQTDERPPTAMAVPIATMGSTKLCCTVRTPARCRCAAFLRSIPPLNTIRSSGHCTPSHALHFGYHDSWTQRNSCRPTLPSKDVAHSRSRLPALRSPCDGY